MKKLILLFALLLGSTVSLLAQDYQEVVYLKNGSIIRGVIIEQIPNVSLKIQTPDNSFFICQMSEVEKITKELQDNRRSRTRYQSSKNIGNAVRGYKGFVETGYYLGLYDESSSSCFELSTSHGYQFNPYIFLGAGVALNYYADPEKRLVPMFIDFRTNFLKNKIAPVGEVKFGYTSGDVYGAYFSTSMGTRFALGAKTALSVKLSYTCQANEDYDYTDGLYSSYTICSSGSLQGFGLKVGFEF